jgi:hypothetical protein
MKKNKMTYSSIVQLLKMQFPWMVFHSHFILYIYPINVGYNTSEIHNKVGTCFVIMTKITIWCLEVDYG